MKAIGMSLLVMSGLSAFIIPWGQTRENEKNTIHGRWIAKSAERNGKAAPDIVDRVLTLRDGQFRVQSKDAEVLFHGKYQVNENTTPATIDFIHQDDWLLGTTWKGIYKLDGDVLQICDNAPFPSYDRPRDFKTRPESNRVSAVFERK